MSLGHALPLQNGMHLFEKKTHHSQSYRIERIVLCLFIYLYLF